MANNQPTLTPHLICTGAAAAIDFYVKIFGAVELFRMPGPDGRLMHAALMIGGSPLFLADSFPEWGQPGPVAGQPSPVVIHMHREDCDAVFEAAVAAGATVTMPMQDMFWGDRYGKLVDPFGHSWSIARTIEVLTPEQMAERGKAAMAEMGMGEGK